MCLHHGVISKDEPIVCPVDEVGNFTDEVPDFAKQNVKVPMRLLPPRRNAGPVRLLRWTRRAGADAVAAAPASRTPTRSSSSC